MPAISPVTPLLLLLAGLLVVPAVWAAAGDQPGGPQAAVSDQQVPNDVPRMREVGQEPRFSWPLSPTPEVTRPFQQPQTEYGPGHRGIDLAATPGQPVLAAGPGVVVFAGQVAAQGVVSIDHDGGLRTTYEPVVPTVPAGTQVYTGQQIGVVVPGHPGCPVAACLHWGVRRGEEYLNPLALIQTKSAIRLKPWEPP